MDFYTYWINWRKAYHMGREQYHQAMLTFYDNQVQAMELWPKMILKSYEAMTAMFMMKNLDMFKPINMFGKWT